MLPITTMHYLVVAAALFVLGTIGRRVLEKAFENSVKAIENRIGALNHHGRIAA